MSNKNKGQNFLLKIDKDQFQKNTKELEIAAKSETSSISTDISSQNKEQPKEKTVTEQKPTEKKKRNTTPKISEPVVSESENQHPILSGNQKYTVRLFDNIHNLLKLYKATRSGADLMETVNRFVLEGLEKDGTLKELQRLQASFKK